MPGLWFEDFEEGAAFDHAQRVEVTQEDNRAFCALTRNTQPLHLDADAAREAGFRDVLVNGLYTFALGVGVSVPDLTEGTIVANLAYEEVVHPHPVHPGDTLRVLTRVLEARPSSRPGRGIVRLEHRILNQDGTEVCRCRRAVLVRNRPVTQEV